MTTASQFAVVWVTAPDLKTGRKLARVVLAARLAACVNIVPKIESHYWWQGKIESGSEVLLIMKTRRTKLRHLERAVLENHPYDTPEFVVLPLIAGSKRYLGWILESVGR